MPAATPRAGSADDVAGFERRVREALARCREMVDELLASPADGFADLRRFDRLLAPLNGLEGRVGLFSLVHPAEKMRRACESLEQEISLLRTELSLDRSLYERIARLRPEDAPSAEERRLLEHALRDFRRSGVDRDEATRERVRALREELVRIGQEFDRNILGGSGEHVVAEGHAGLAGLPSDFLASHPERADGSVVLTTDPADRTAVLTYAEREELRRDYFLKCMNRAVPGNLEVLPRLLAKRHELARLLGYDHWADYVTEDKMAGSAAGARRFLEGVLGRVRARAEAECAEALDEKRRGGEGPAARVEEWDRFFLLEKVRRRRFALDSRQVRPYFPLARVVEGVLATTARLFGVELRPDPEARVWHRDVQAWVVLEDGQPAARFFLDLHPRENKYKHAAMFDLQKGLRGETLPEGALVCNFPRPTESDPALLTHDQVQTLFHELGHLLHHLFAGRQRFLAFSGIATEDDFDEAPSQMFEEWAWSTEVLKRFARHHGTGEPIPAETVRTMRAADEWGKALHALVQTFLALLSLSCYDRDPAGLDPHELMVALKRELLPIPHAEGSNFQASFGHLHDYSAMYYTYLWSLVIAKDLFSRFEPDLMDPRAAEDFRARVLAPGGSRDARELVRAFLGRDYSFDAFERWLAV